MTDLSHSPPFRSIHLTKIKQPALIALAGFLVGRLFLQLNLYRIGFESFMADDFGRTLLAARWAEAPYLIWDGFLLPFHLYLHGLALKLSWNLYDTPRVINTLLGLAAIILIYYLTLELFQSRTAALISAALLTVNPVHSWLSATTLAELPQSTLVLAAVLGFTIYLKRQTSRSLYLSALALALGNGFRYESWMVSIVFTLYLGLEIIREFRQRGALEQQILHLSAAAILPWLFPLAWMLGNQIVRGDFLFFMKFTTNDKLFWYGTESSYRNYWPYFLLIDRFATRLMPFIAAIALWQHRRSKPFRWFILIAAAPFIIFLYLHGGMADDPGNYLRYLGLFFFLFYPLMAYAINKGMEKVTTKTAVRMAGVGVIVILISLVQVRTTFRFVQALQGLDTGQRLQALRLEEPELAERPVMIELIYWEQLAIHVGANDISPLILYDRQIDFKRKSPSLFQTDPETIRNCLAFHHVGYLLLKSPEFIALAEEELRLSPSEQVEGYNFYKIPSNLTADPTPACPFTLDNY